MTDQQAKEYALRHRRGGFNERDRIASIEQQMPEAVNELMREEPHVLGLPFALTPRFLEIDRLIAGLPYPDI